MSGDFTSIENQQCDLLVGGTPCQSFSTAGLRGGLGDSRGNLALEFCRLADRLRPRWLVWENVPGVLSSNGGRDFGSILGAMVRIGYGVAYRVLDAQFYGVPQRRRRVFVIGYFDDWRRAAAVLFESESLRGNSTTRRKARPKDPRDIMERVGGCSVECVTGRVTHALRAGGFDASEDGTGRGTPIIPFDGYRVRRLTPRECERLQGFPDDYTLIPGASDSARYRALGNSMAVPVMRWIGERMARVDTL